MLKSKLVKIGDKLVEAQVKVVTVTNGVGSGRINVSKSLIGNKYTMYLVDETLL